AIGHPDDPDATDTHNVTDNEQATRNSSANQTAGQAGQPNVSETLDHGIAFAALTTRDISDAATGEETV
ncbi:hypothetical protein, partial [Staphylococcus aureus]